MTLIFCAEAGPGTNNASQTAAAKVKAVRIVPPRIILDKAKTKGRPSLNGAAVCPGFTWRSRGSEGKFQSELKQAWVVYRRVHDSERAAVGIAKAGCDVSIRQSELRMVKDVEEFRAEVNSGTLGDGETLDEREIGVHEVGTEHRSARCASKLADWSSAEASGIEPLSQAVMAVIGIAALVRAIPVGSVVLERNARLIVAVDHKIRESGQDSFDHGNLPVAQNSVRRATPVAAIGLALAEGKVINHAGGELMIEVDLRPTPIGFVGTRQGPIRRPDARSDAIG